MGVASGLRLVEIGGGPQARLRILSKRVRPSGRVVGVGRN